MEHSAGTLAPLASAVALALAHLLAGRLRFRSGRPAAGDSPLRSESRWRTSLRISSPIAFIAGGVILNVLKEELPGERQARFAPFALGAGAYAALLQAL